MPCRTPGHHRRARRFRFHRDPLSTTAQDQIDLRPTRRPVKVGLPLGEHPHQLFQHKAFPGRPQDRMPQDRITIGQLQQRVQETTIAQIDLGRLDEALADIRVVGWQEADHERLREELEIRSEGRMAHPEGRPQL